MQQFQPNGASRRQIGASACSLGAALSLLLALALPARASEVRDVRIGRHPTFSRVVFELDARAGYRIERNGQADKSVVVVKLEASSTARRLSSSAELVRGVELSPEGNRSVARIQLEKPGLPIKEMILSDPPRIVLDFLISGDAQKVAASEGRSSAAPRKTAAVAKAPAREEKKPAEAAPTRKAEAPEAEPERPAPTPSALQGTGVASAPVAEQPLAGKLEPAKQPSYENDSLMGSETPRPAESEEREYAKTVDTGPLADAPLESEEDAADDPSPAPVRPPEAAPAPALAEKPAPQAPSRPVAVAEKAAAPEVAEPDAPGEAGGPSVQLLAAAGVGLALVLGAGLALMRRRSLPNDADVLPFDEAAAALEDDDDLPTPRSALFEGDGESEAPAREADPSLPFGGEGFSVESESAASLGSPATSLFDDEDEKSEEQSMDPMDTQLGVTPRGAMPRMPSLGEDSDLARVVAELERRLTQTEQRAQEQNETIERLERQVAAQAEELRVQRAAIARTQRALRSMSRTDEEQATEPALRDPR